MKKYLGIAALLGVIAFVSVSILAQADPQERLPAPQNHTTQTITGQNAPLNKNASETAASDEVISVATTNDALQKLVGITPAAGPDKKTAAVPEKDEWQDVDPAEDAAAKNFLADSSLCEEQTLKHTGTTADDDAANADEQKAFAACMMSKGYSKDDISAQMSDDDGSNTEAEDATAPADENSGKTTE